MLSYKINPYLDGEDIGFFWEGTTKDFLEHFATEKMLVRFTEAGRINRIPDQLLRMCEVARLVLCDSGHYKPCIKSAICGRRRNERYDNTGLFTVTYQLIYRHCTCTVQGVGVHPLV
jgi:hypothetical protein